jgi:hypothetical protein
MALSAAVDARIAMGDAPLSSLSRRSAAQRQLRSKVDQRLQQPAEQPVKPHIAVKRGKADALRLWIDDGLVIDVNAGFVKIAGAVAAALVGK